MNGTIQTTVQCGGVSIQSQITRTEESSVVPFDSTLAAGIAGTLSTRTDDNTGIVTVADAGDLVDTDTVAVYWADGVRHGMDVGSVTPNGSVAIAIDLGTGDVLPAATTAVVICKETTVNSDFDGDDMALLAAYSNKRAHLVFETSAGASLLALELTAENPLYWWATNTEIARPITGSAVDRIIVSNGETTTAAMKIVALVSSVA